MVTNQIKFKASEDPSSTIDNNDLSQVNVSYANRPQNPESKQEPVPLETQNQEIQCFQYFQELSSLRNSDLGKLSVPSFIAIDKPELQPSKHVVAHTDNKAEKTKPGKQKKRGGENRFNIGDGTILDIIITVVANLLARMEGFFLKPKPIPEQQAMQPKSNTKKTSVHKRHSLSTGFFSEIEDDKEENEFSSEPILEEEKPL